MRIQLAFVLMVFFSKVAIGQSNQEETPLRDALNGLAEFTEVPSTDKMAKRFSAYLPDISLKRNKDHLVVSQKLSSKDRIFGRVVRNAYFKILENDSLEISYLEEFQVKTRLTKYIASFENSRVKYLESNYITHVMGTGSSQEKEVIKNHSKEAKEYIEALASSIIDGNNKAYFENYLSPFKLKVEFTERINVESRCGVDANYSVLKFKLEEDYQSLNAGDELGIIVICPEHIQPQLDVGSQYQIPVRKFNGFEVFILRNQYFLLGLPTFIMDSSSELMKF